MVAAEEHMDLIPAQKNISLYLTQCYRPVAEPTELPLDLCFALVMRIEVSASRRRPEVTASEGIAKHALHP